MSDLPLKICRTCKIGKPHSREYFYQVKERYKALPVMNPECIPCHKILARKRYIERKERLKKQQK